MQMEYSKTGHELVIQRRLLKCMYPVVWYAVVFVCDHILSSALIYSARFFLSSVPVFRLRLLLLLFCIHSLSMKWCLWQNIARDTIIHGTSFTHIPFNSSASHSFVRSHMNAGIRLLDKDQLIQSMTIHHRRDMHSLTTTWRLEDPS